MKVVITIAARLASTRLPGKVLKDICGQSIIEHLIDRMKECKQADEVILCTSTHPDDQILRQFAEKKGVRFFAGSKDNVMIRFLEAAKKANADAVVRVTGDNPLTSPCYIDNAIKHHLKTGADYTSTTELPQGTKGEVISVEALQRANDCAENPNYSEYMTWYFTDNPDFFHNENGPVDDDMKRRYRLTVDTPEDFELMTKIYEELYDGNIIPLRDAIKFLDGHPEIAAINSMIKSKNLKHKVNVKMRKECRK